MGTVPNILSCLNSQIDDKDYKLGMAVLLDSYELRKCFTTDRLCYFSAVLVSYHFFLRLRWCLQVVSVS